MKIKLSSGLETMIYKWESKNPKAIMQIVHGSAEHASRYEHFAKWLNTKGISVWAMDLRGHGELEAKRNNLGYFGRSGKTSVIEDVNEVAQLMKKEHPGLSYTLMGHSMGSFVVRATALKYSSSIDKLIAVGTNHQRKIISAPSSIIARLVNLLLPSKAKAKWLDKMSYKAFDKKIKAKTSGQWLSKNKENIKAFNEDSLNGFMFTRNGFDTMSSWVNTINSMRRIKKQSKDMKVLFLAGSEDPVGNMSKEVLRADKAYRSAGLDSRAIIYPTLRHEILNEKEKMKVYEDILKFIMA